MFDRIKSLFKNKPDKDNNWRNLNKDDKDALIKNLLDRLYDLEFNFDLMKKEFGELSAYCDKCNGSKTKSYCLKCSGTGIVKKSRLMGWPWA